MVTAELLERSARARGSAPAVVDLEGRSLSYEDLLRRVDRVAAALDAYPGPDGFVIVSLPNGIEAAVAALGALCSRQVAVLLHPELPPATRAEAVGRLRPVAEVGAEDGEVAVRPSRVPPLGPVWQAPSALPEMRIALAVLTSGSSGAPRAVLASERQMSFVRSMIARRLAYRREDVIAVAPPLSFDFGLYQLLLAADAGATALLDPRLGSVQGLARAIGVGGATVLPLVPPALRALLGSRLLEGVDTTGMRLVTTTGDLLAEADVGAARAVFPRAEVVPMYGFTECKRVAISPPGEPRPSGAVGLPLDETDVAVAGAAAPRLGPGQVGELVVSGGHLTLGYDRDPEATSRRYGVDPGAGIRILRSGDRLAYDERGWLHWHGRGADLIKTAGYRVSPAEIEGAAWRSGMVIECGAFGRTDPLRGQVPVLVVRLREGPNPERARHELRQALRARLPRWAMPELEVRSDPLPRTANGKIDRAALGAEPSVAAAEAPHSPAAPLPSLAEVPYSRRLVNCHTQALLSAWTPPHRIGVPAFELLTGCPFGVRSRLEDPQRLLIPHLDPDLGLDRACELLGLEVETRAHRREEADRALATLTEWSRLGPVLLGPLDLGRLAHSTAAASLRGCDHYVAALGFAEGGALVIRDPEGFVQVEVTAEALLSAWRAESVPEGRGCFVLRRLSVGADAGLSAPANLAERLEELALQNLREADDAEAGGGDAYAALAELALDATRTRALSFLLPSAAMRSRLAGWAARSLFAPAGSPERRRCWLAIAGLYAEQEAVLAEAHGRLLDEEADPLRGLRDAAEQETEIAAQAALRSMARAAG